MDYSIKINKDKIIAFKLPIELEIINKYNEIEIFIKDIIEDDKTIEIQAEYIVEQKKYNFRKYYKKESLNPYDLLFIGWSYLLKYEDRSKEKFLEKSRDYLLSSIKNKIDSCIPHYLLAKYPINYIGGFNSFISLYYAINNYKDAFPDFYSLLYIKDKNKIRASGILKKGLERFPKSFILAYHYSNYLIKSENYSEALEVLQKVEVVEYEQYGFKYYYDSIYNIFTCFIHLNDFVKAERLIDDQQDYFEDFEIALLKGILYYYKKDFEIAIKHFTECIQKDYRELTNYASHFFLLDCYLMINDTKNIKELINILPENEIDYFVFPFEIIYLDIAEKCYREIIELEIDEITKSKAKGFLASLILYKELPDFDNETKRKLTQKEIQLLNEAKILIKSALDYHPSNIFFLSIYSDILYYEENFDESLIIKLKLLKEKQYSKDSDIYPTVSLEDCSEIFINNYPNKLEELFYNNKGFRDFYIIEQLSYDMESLFKLKKYNIIVDLYFLLKSNPNILKIDSLFEIAYSLKELNYVDEAILVYKKSIDLHGGSSSVYNNLAIIYEEKKYTNKAIEFIKKAKKLSKDDLIVESNYKRILTKVSSKKENKIEITRNKKKDRLAFDPGSSRITYGEKFCQIPINTYEYYLCKIIFEKSLGSKTQEEEILEVLDRAKLEEKRRTIYDTCIRVNKKVEESLGLKKILINKASMVWVRDEFII
jgi:tetratricopeptide (TPR) repeat protein